MFPCGRPCDGDTQRFEPGSERRAGDAESFRGLRQIALGLFENFGEYQTLGQAGDFLVDVVRSGLQALARELSKSSASRAMRDQLPLPRWNCSASSSGQPPWRVST